MKNQGLFLLKKYHTLRSLTQGICFNFLVIISFIFLNGCAFNQASIEFFFGVPDKILTDDINIWLKAGKQSNISEKILKEASMIDGAKRRERLYKSISYLWDRFKYDRLQNNKMATKTADELFTNNVLGGCLDYALVESTFFRALKIPSRIVITADSNWIKAYRKNPLSMPEGHAFVEVYLENDWHLVDSTFRYIYSGYNQNLIFFPKNELFCKRGRDFEDMDIKNIEQLNYVMKECAEKYLETDYKEPLYNRQKI